MLLTDLSTESKRSNGKVNSDDECTCVLCRGYTRKGNTTYGSATKTRRIYNMSAKEEILKKAKEIISNDRNGNSAMEMHSRITSRT